MSRFEERRSRAISLVEMRFLVTAVIGFDTYEIAQVVCAIDSLKSAVKSILNGDQEGDDASMPVKKSRISTVIPGDQPHLPHSIVVCKQQVKSIPPRVARECGVITDINSPSKDSLTNPHKKQLFISPITSAPSAIQRLSDMHASLGISRERQPSSCGVPVFPVPNPTFSRATSHVGRPADPVDSLRNQVSTRNEREDSKREFDQAVLGNTLDKASLNSSKVISFESLSADEDSALLSDLNASLDSMVSPVDPGSRSNTATPSSSNTRDELQPMTIVATCGQDTKTPRSCMYDHYSILYPRFGKEEVDQMMSPDFNKAAMETRRRYIVGAYTRHLLQWWLATHNNDKILSSEKKRLAIILTDTFPALRDDSHSGHETFFHTAPQYGGYIDYSLKNLKQSRRVRLTGRKRQRNRPNPRPTFVLPSRQINPKLEPSQLPINVNESADLLPY